MSHNTRVTQIQIDAARVGDKVYIVHGRNREYASLRTIVHITPTKRIQVTAYNDTVSTYKARIYAGTLGLQSAGDHPQLPSTYLVLDTARVEAETAHEGLSRAAANALDAIACPCGVRHTWSKEAMETHLEHVENLLRAARIAIAKL